MQEQETMDSEIKVGDKVRFLNSVGGGIVKGFQGKGTVLVEDADGFEMPTLARELVVVEELTSQKHSPQPKPHPAAPKPEPPKVAAAPRVQELPGGESLNLWLAFLPVDPKSPGTSFEAYFVNESNYYLFINYMSRSNNAWTSRYNGLVEPNTKIFMEEFSKELLNDLQHVCLQCLAFKKDKTYALKPAYSVELPINTVKFYKLHCFVENDFFDDDALLFPLVRQDRPERELLVSAADLEEGMQKKADIDRRPVHKAPAHKKKPEDEIIEVDLHINQLLDDTSGMKPADMLNYQLDTFRRVLGEHKPGSRIVFIHGKGDGVLRAAIERELKTKYKNCSYQDASFREYGFGATLVTIHQAQ